MTNDVTSQKDNVPDWMLQKSTGVSIGNLGAADIKPPEVKLLQATSPEAAEQPGAQAGSFWLTGRNVNLGPEILGTPIILRRTFVLWNPTRSLDSKAPLATASDGVRWDVPDQTFEVFYPNNKTPYIWKTKRTVAESGLDQFGSSRPEDKRSPPAASETYQILWAFRLPDGRPQLGIITNSRTGIKPVRELFGMIDGWKPVDHYFLRFRICAVRLSPRPGEYFFGFKYLGAGRVQDEAEGDSYKALFERYRKAGFTTTDFTDEVEKATPIRTYEAASEDADEIQY